MAVLEKLKKALRSGSQVSLVGLRRIGSEIGEVASSLKKDPPRLILKIPKGKPIGTVYWSVSVDEPIKTVTFAKKKDAASLKRLLSKGSIHPYSSDIVRREITDKGYEPTYEDGK